MKVRRHKCGVDAQGWTLASYVIHSEALRDAQTLLDAERDRRYSEVNIEKEKALKIKETADLAALSLARESQTYKEQQNDALRDKNLSESGVYATNVSVANAISELRSSLQPLVDYVAGQKGLASGTNLTWGRIYAAIGGIAGILGIVYLIFKPT